MSKAQTHKQHSPIDTTLIDSLRALGAKSVVIESSPDTVDIYLDVVSRSRRASKLSGLKITVRNGVLIGLHSRAQCKHDIPWAFHDGEPAQRVADRMLAECSGNVVNKRHECAR